METEQTMACLLAEIRNQEEMTASLEAKMDANQDKSDTWLQEMKAWWKETMGCQGVKGCLQKSKAKSENTKGEMEEVEAMADVFKG